MAPFEFLYLLTFFLEDHHCPQEQGPRWGTCNSVIYTWKFKSSWPCLVLRMLSLGFYSVTCHWWFLRTIGQTYRPTLWPLWVCCLVAVGCVTVNSCELWHLIFLSLELLAVKNSYPRILSLQRNFITIRMFILPKCLCWFPVLETKWCMEILPNCPRIFVVIDSRLTCLLHLTVFLRALI